MRQTLPRYCLRRNGLNIDENYLYCHYEEEIIEYLLKHCELAKCG